MRWLREGDEGLYFLTEPWKEESLRNGFVKTEALQRNIDCIRVCVLGWVVDSHTLSSSRHKSQLNKGNSINECAAAVRATTLTNRSD